MPLPDHRIRLPAPKIDFEADVGITGQDHDEYPAAGTQARADWMRMYLIGLLTNQSSYDEPTQKRDGTIWFDLNSATFKVWTNETWVLLSEAIPLEIEDDEVTTLKAYYDSIKLSLTQLAPEVVFNGVTTTNTNSITIPESLRSHLSSSTRCFLYVDGILVDPRKCVLLGSPPTTISFTDFSISAGSNFTICLRNVPSATFYVPNVVP